MIEVPKLLIATDTFLPKWNGITRFLTEVIPSLANHFEITLVCPDTKEHVALGKIRIVKIQKARALQHEIEKADIVFTQTVGRIGTASIKLASNYKKPIVHYVHTLPWEQSHPVKKTFYHLRSKLLLRRAKVILVSSLKTAKKLQRRKIKNSLVIIPPGVDSERFVPTQKEQAKQALGIDPSLKVIGYIGDFSSLKNFQTAFRAFRRLTSIHHNVFFLVIAQGNKRWERKVRQQEHTRLIKSTDNIVPYLQAMDIFVQPSLKETSSIATLEAMATGTAVITSHAGDLSEYIKDKENGLFYPAKNDTILMLKISWLLKEEFVRVSLGKAGRATVQHHFKWDETKKKLLQVLESISA